MAPRVGRGSFLPANGRARHIGGLVVSLLIMSFIVIAPGAARSEDAECRADPPGPTVSGCGEIGADSPSVSWTGTKKSTAYPPPSPAGGPPAIAQSLLDHYYLTLNSPMDFRVDISWDEPSNDFDLFVYRGRLRKDQAPPNGAGPGDFGESLGSSQRRTGTSESVSIRNGKAIPGVYTIRVQYLRVVESSYRGSASLVGNKTGVGCTPDHVWFLGIVYDEAQRDDFKEDVRHFEAFLTSLRKTYCIPESQATILAMEGDYKDGETTYAEASEANLKDELRRMGEESSAHADAQFFFFLSSHGLVWNGAIPEVEGVANRSACPPDRLVHSFAGLKEGNEEDGLLDDCELGHELNNSFLKNTRMFIAVDCSLCGGFSDSLTGASGTVPDGSVPVSSGVPGDNRVVVTGCAITTECFGSETRGGIFYWHMRRVLHGIIPCDGWTAPEFPEIQGFDIPVHGAPFNPPDGNCTASEWFFAAVRSAYIDADLHGIQQQFRIKYGFPTLQDDVLIATPRAAAPDPTTSPSPTVTPTPTPDPDPTPTPDPDPTPTPDPDPTPTTEPGTGGEPQPAPTPDATPTPTPEPTVGPEESPPEIVQTGPCRGLAVGSTQANPDDTTGMGQILVGTEANDVLRGTAGQDVICGLGGDDVLVGRAADDLLTGNSGNDLLRGGSGADALRAGGGKDRLLGGIGKDKLFGGAGRDALRGGRGHDRFDGGRGKDRCYGGPGRDVFKRCR